MSDLNYASNSDSTHEAKENKQPKSKVISGEVSAKQETKLGKLASIFIAEDVSNVKDYVWTSVIVPMCKRGLVELVNTGSDLISNAFSMLVYGTPNQPRKGSNFIGSKRDYDKCFGPTAHSAPKRDAEEVHHPTKDFIFEHRDEAERVLANMLRDIQDYNAATLSDLYGYIGKTPSIKDNWQADSIGWDDLSMAYIERVRGGWLLAMPALKTLRVR